MRSFLKQVCIFIFLAAVFVEVSCVVLIVSNLFLIRYPGREIYTAMAKSKQKNKSKKVLIGDSVSQQLFPNEGEYENLNSLACNQAIGIVGQYLLINNYIKAGNKIDTLVGFFNPFSFSDNLDQTFTYHYFLKPFDTREYATYFTPAVENQLNTIPYRHFNKVPHIYVSSWGPDVQNGEKHWTFLSPISADYLRKIKQLAVENHFTFILYPVPLSESRRKDIQALDSNEIEQSGLKKELTQYFDKVQYLNDSLFKDGTHLHHPELLTQTYQKLFSE